MTVWQRRLSGRLRDAVTAYYARYPDASPEEIEAWLRDRGFEVTRNDIEDFMALLDAEPGWRTGWINRNIGAFSEAFDPDQVLLVGERSDDERAPGAAAAFEEDLAAQGAADEMSGEYLDEYEDEYEEEETAIAGGATAPDWVPGLVLGGLGLAACIGVTALVLALVR